MFLTGSEFGCPPRCASDWLQSSYLTSCSDLSPHELRTAPGWVAGWNMMVSFHGRFKQQSREKWQQLTDLFMSAGCEALGNNVSSMWPTLADVTKDRLCYVTTNMLNVAAFCPEACGCFNT